MSKEIVLQNMKDIVLFMEGKTIQDLKKPEVKKIFDEKKDHIDKGCKSLNTCEMLWVDEQYGKFIKEIIEPRHKDIIEKAKLYGPINAEQLLKIIYKK